MTAAPVPLDKTDRLRALRATGLLDSAPEHRFARITRTARRLFSMPILLISLVDGNGQWFKSRIGFEPAELPRGFSFCGHALLTNNAFVVADAADVCFADNPLVTGEQHLRFYASVPLSSVDGHNIGTLQSANILAEEQQSHLRAIVDNAGDGIITIDQRGIIESFNPGVACRFGYLLIFFDASAPTTGYGNCR